MITLTERSAGPMTLRAPVGGTVRFRAPAALCGELEIFEPGDTVEVPEIGCTDTPPGTDGGRRDDPVVCPGVLASRCQS